MQKTKAKDERRGMTIYVNVPKDEIAKLDKLAAKDQRTRSNLISVIIREYVQRAA